MMHTLNGRVEHECTECEYILPASNYQAAAVVVDTVLTILVQDTILIDKNR